MTMARPRRHTRNDVDLLAVLRSGETPAEDAGGRRLARPLMADLRRVWKTVGDRLVREHIAECPGSRPWAWWSIGEGRKILRAANRKWPLHEQWRVISRNRFELSAYDQKELLASAGLLAEADDA